MVLTPGSMLRDHCCQVSRTIYQRPRNETKVGYIQGKYLTCYLWPIWFSFLYSHILLTQLVPIIVWGILFLLWGKGTLGTRSSSSGGYSYVCTQRSLPVMCRGIMKFQEANWSCPRQDKYLINPHTSSLAPYGCVCIHTYAHTQINSYGIRYICTHI